MSVQSEIDRIITAVGNAYSKVSEKGGTVVLQYMPHELVGHYFVEVT